MCYNVVVGERRERAGQEARLVIKFITTERTMDRQTIGNWVVTSIGDYELLISPVINGVAQSHFAVAVRLREEGKTAWVETNIYKDAPRMGRGVRFNVLEV